MSCFEYKNIKIELDNVFQVAQFVDDLSEAIGKEINEFLNYNFGSREIGIYFKDGGYKDIVFDTEIEANTFMLELRSYLNDNKNLDIKILNYDI